jgi:AraC-like DNA-binding protein
MAEKFGLSESSLTYQFKKYWSYTPTEYISRRRTAMAQRIIAAGHRSIDDVAVDVGFGSYLTMHRAFKKYYGAPPGAFRLKNGGD